MDLRWVLFFGFWTLALASPQLDKQTSRLKIYVDEPKPQNAKILIPASVALPLGAALGAAGLYLLAHNQVDHSDKFPFPESLDETQKRFRRSLEEWSAPEPMDLEPPRFPCHSSLDKWAKTFGPSVFSEPCHLFPPLRGAESPNPSNLIYV